MNDFTIPTFLKKDKTSKVKAVNLTNKKRIDDFINNENGWTPVADDEDILKQAIEETPGFNEDYGFDEEDEFYVYDEDDNIAADENRCIDPDENRCADNVTQAQLESVARIARALRPQEIEVVLDNIPITYIFDKIGKELEKNRKFSEAILNATDIIK